MKKEDIIDILNKYNFDKDKYVVISGAAMVMYGIKEETHDIDISCTKDFYDYLLENYDCVYERTNEFGVKAYMIDDIINFSTSLMPDKKEIVDGITISSIEDIIKLKKYFGRQKDINDLEKIQNYIKSNKNI